MAGTAGRRKPRSYDDGVSGYFLHLTAIIWIAWVATWLAAALVSAPATAEAPRRAYAGHLALAVVGFYGLFLGRRVGLPPMWHAGQALGWTMIAVQLAGIAFAWWARITMGRLWSGNVARKDGHHVIDRGPFALVRHPIYSGIIVSSLAVAGIDATPLSFVGVALIAVGFGLKARVEERFLEDALPDYAEYRARVPMLVPGLR